jgi:hypothetical protein
MSRSVARKRARKRNQYGIDYDASQEGTAIANSLKTHTIDFGKATSSRLAKNIDVWLWA